MSANTNRNTLCFTWVVCWRAALVWSQMSERAVLDEVHRCSSVGGENLGARWSEWELSLPLALRESPVNKHITPFLLLFYLNGTRILLLMLFFYFLKVLTLESLLSSDMLDEESGLSGGEESTCKDSSFSILTSDGVCKGAALNRKHWKTNNPLLRTKTKHMSLIFCGLILVFLTGCFVLCSSSCALQSSCSKELASSLNKPTSSQFFRKRVGVGVWSVEMNTTLSLLLFTIDIYKIIIDAYGITCNDDRICSSRTKF